MTDLLEISFKFPDWAGKVKAHADELNLLQAAIIQANRGMLFDAEGAHNGHPKWAPLKFRTGQILSKRGTLRKSIAPRNPKGSPGDDGIVNFGSDTITIGTRLLYARMMNDGTTKLPGGVLTPKNAKALKIPVPQGRSAGPAAKAIQVAALAPKIAAAHKRAMLARNGTKSQERAYATWQRLLAKAKEGKGSVKFIFVTKVKITPRNFVDWNDDDQREVDAALMDKIVGILNG